MITLRGAPARNAAIVTCNSVVIGFVAADETFFCDLLRRPHPFLTVPYLFTPGNQNSCHKSFVVVTPLRDILAMPQREPTRKYSRFMSVVNFIIAAVSYSFTK